MGPYLLSGVEVDVADAQTMAVALRQGWRPPPQPAWFRLLPGEALIAELPVWVQEFATADAAFEPVNMWAWGSPALVAGTVLASAVVNTRRHREAERRAAPQWRAVDSGQLYLTTWRLAVFGTQAWGDWPYESLCGLTADTAGVIAVAAGAAHTRFVIDKPLTHLVLARFLAFGEIPGLPAPPALGPAGADPAAAPPELRFVVAPPDGAPEGWEGLAGRRGRVLRFVRAEDPGDEDEDEDDGGAGGAGVLLYEVLLDDEPRPRLLYSDWLSWV